jgi:MinD superfamily P-loop ATPase
MTELVIVSGKGGTGKTSLVGALAALSRDKVLVDCDVDAADLHLILKHKMRESTKFIASSRASIVPEKCTACGLCLDYCRFDAIKHEPDSDSPNGERYWIDELACDGCGVCPRFCPEEAIDFKETVSGEWFLSETSYGPLVHARLGIAQSNSGKLVSLLRKKAKSLAVEKQLDLIIVDGPPGIGCPVIASITGAGFVLIVTEPSLSAFHDLERLWELARHFGIPAGLCINKYDINPELAARMETFAQDKKIKMLGKMTYDPVVTKAQVAGTTFVEYTHNGVSAQVKALWNNLQNALQTSQSNKMELKT